MTIEEFLNHPGAINEYEAHRAVDLALERLARNCPSDSDLHIAIGQAVVAAQIANVMSLRNKLIDFYGINPNKPEGGLYCYIAAAFAEWSEHNA